MQRHQNGASARLFDFYIHNPNTREKRGEKVIKLPKIMHRFFYGFVR